MSDAISNSETAASAAVTPPVSLQLEGRQLSATQVADAKQDWISRGFDPATFDAAFTAPVQAGSETATPTRYHPQYGQYARATPIERLMVVDRELQQFGSALGLSAEVGKGVIEHLAEWGPKLKVADPVQKLAWLQEQQAAALRAAGSEEALAALREKASSLLLRSGNQVAFELAHSTVFQSSWLLSVLAAQAEEIQS